MPGLETSTGPLFKVRDLVLSFNKYPALFQGLVASTGTELKTKKKMKEKISVVIKRFTLQEPISQKKER